MRISFSYPLGLKTLALVLLSLSTSHQEYDSLDGNRQVLLKTEIIARLSQDFTNHVISAALADLTDRQCTTNVPAIPFRLQIGCCETHSLVDIRGKYCIPTTALPTRFQNKTWLHPDLSSIFDMNEVLYTKRCTPTSLSRKRDASLIHTG